jgi:predicted Ser/Thr protein kinase
MPENALPDDLLDWADRSLRDGAHVLATSNQGTVLHYEQGGHDLVLKTAMGRGAALRARRATLAREYGAYRILEGIPGVPRCHGMLGGRYLVLQHVRGTPYREAVIEDRERWFALLLETLKACHGRGVAHGDLKRKSNLLAGDDGRPWIIDFGLTVVRKEGFHPINHRLFSFFRQLDLNAWIKHKYQGRFDEVSETDRAYYHDTLIERVTRRQRQWRGIQGSR